MISLRDYQQRSINMLADSLRRGHKSPVMVAPTGAGKTRIAAAICERAVSKGNRVIFLAPRRGLVWQTADSFQELGLDCGVIMSGVEYDSRHQVDVASIDTVTSRIGKVSNALLSIQMASLIIVDEAHTSVSRSRAAMLNDIKAGAYGESKRIVGLTASPCVSGGGGLGAVYDDLITPVLMHDLIDDGYLVQPRYFSAERPDLSGVKIIAGEYNQNDLGDKYSGSVIMGDVLSNWKRIAENTITVIFTPTRKNAADLVERFNSAGYPAAYVDANTPDSDRESIYSDLSSGKIKVLANVGVVSMGTDIPNIQTVVMATATKSVAKWMQAIGRALRPAPGKECAYIIDHGGMSLDPQMGPVEYIVDWSLDEKERINKRIEIRKKEKKEPKDITCIKCKSVFKSARKCPSCGHEMKQSGEPLEYHEADLKETNVKDSSAIKRNKKEPKEKKRDFYSQLLGYCHKTGKREGWAAHKYRERYGVWPNAHKKAAPIEPSMEVMNWIKSRNIAWAKSRGMS